jgi:hypothetical protein
MPFVCRMLHTLDASVLIQAPCSVIFDVVSSCASHLSCTIKNFVDTTLMLSIIYASFVPSSLCLQHVIHEICECCMLEYNCTFFMFLDPCIFVYSISRPTDATCDRFYFLSICVLYMFRASSVHHRESSNRIYASNFL